MKKQSNTPATPDSEADSLDFTDPEPAKSRAPAPAPRARAKREKPAGSRRLPVLVVMIIAVAVVAFAMMQRFSKELVAPPPSARSSSPAYQSPPAYKPPQTDTPASKVAAPPAPPAVPRSTPTPAIPAEFLKAFEAYTKKSGGKAIALALGNDGKWAYGSVAGYTAQSDANEEAVSECTRFKNQAHVQANCRLYAVGDKVVW